MYGIYKAAGPGGYNIEPKAFKLAFPSQVRFTVLEDCLPLAEETFRKAIKDNYYTRSKFDCQLTSEQVKSLCKLFLAAGKGSKSKNLDRSQRAENRTHKGRDRTLQLAWDEKRLSTIYGDRRYHKRPIMYEREAFASPVAPLPRIPHLPPPPLAPAPSYAYERTLEMDAYRHYPLSEHHDRQLLDLEQKHSEEIELRDPYVSYGKLLCTVTHCIQQAYHKNMIVAVQVSGYHHLADLQTEHRSAAVDPWF